MGDLRPHGFWRERPAAGAARQRPLPGTRVPVHDPPDPAALDGSTRGRRGRGGVQAEARVARVRVERELRRRVRGEAQGGEPRSGGLGTRRPERGGRLARFAQVACDRECDRRCPGFATNSRGLGMRPEESPLPVVSRGRGRRSAAVVRAGVGLDFLRTRRNLRRRLERFSHACRKDTQPRREGRLAPPNRSSPATGRIAIGGDHRALTLKVLSGNMGNTLQ